MATEGANRTLEDSEKTTTRMVTHSKGLSHDREPFRQLIERYHFHQANKGEYETINALTRHICRETDCFFQSRRNGGNSISASVLLMRHGDYRALYLYRKKERRWVLPSGFSDGDPNIYRAVKRGLKEETGVIIPDVLDRIPLDICHIDFPKRTRGNPMRVFRLIFMAMLPPNQWPTVLSSEYCDELFWVNPDEATRIFRNSSFDGGDRLIEKWRNAIPRLKIGS